MFPARRIFRDVGEDSESVLSQQRFVFQRGKAGMVQRLAVILSDRFTMHCSGGEQEQGVRRSVFAEHRKHFALIGVVEMKKAVPRDQAVEFLPQRKLTHVRNDPSRPWGVLAAVMDERFGRIDACDCAAAIQQVLANWGAGATAEIKNAPPRRYAIQKTIEPRLPVPRYAQTIGNVLIGEPFVEVADGGSTVIGQELSTWRVKTHAVRSYPRRGRQAFP